MKCVKRPIVIVVGLDGASWYLLYDWIISGCLPTFREIMRNGVYSNLVSTLPMMTCPAWKSLTSGLTPRQIGAYGFVIPDFKSKKCTFVDSTLLKGKDIWTYLSKRGFKVCVINVPWSYPPSKVNGVFIAGFPCTDDQDYTYPPSIKKLLTNIGYSIDLLRVASIVNKSQLSLKEYIHQINLKFSIARTAIRLNYDFIFLVIFYIDKISHFLWNDEITLTIFRSIDSELNSLLSELEKRGRPFALFVVSDHGMYPTSLGFELNTWLYKEGYLKLSDDVISRKISIKTLRKSFLITQVRNALTQLSIVSDILHLMLVNLSKKKLIGPLLKHVLTTSFDGRLSDVDLIKYIDLNKTKAMALQQCIYVLENDPGKYNTLAREIASKLEKLRDPVFNKKVVKKCIIVESRAPFKRPAILIEPEKGVNITNKLSFSKQPFKIISKRHGMWIANHIRNGVFIAYGNIIKKLGKLPEVDIKDITPTVLHIFGISKSYMVKGKVLDVILDLK